MKLTDIAAIFSVQSRGRGWVGLAVLGLLLLTAVVIAAQVPSLLRAGSVPTDVDVQPLSGDAMKTRTDGFKKSTASAADKVIARAPFYPPKPKVAPPPPAPTRYNGPAIIAMVADTVFFADGKRLKAGGPAEDGITVISTDAPWSAKLKYNGGEFTVNLFERDPVKLNAGLGGSTVPPGMAGGAIQKPEPTPPAPASPPAASPAPASPAAAPAGTPPPGDPPSPPQGDPNNGPNNGPHSEPNNEPSNEPPAGAPGNTPPEPMNPEPASPTSTPTPSPAPGPTNNPTPASPEVPPPGQAPESVRKN